MIVKKTLAAIVFSLSLCACSSDQSAEVKPVNSLPFTDLKLDDIGATEKTGDWKITSAVYMSRKDEGKVQAGDGQGILFCNAINGKPARLTTKVDHADIDLELDFMTSKASMGAVWLQGRYKVSLKDSWKLEKPAAQDCGGIVTALSNDSVGVPKLNAAKAPGLWQHLYISFTAARFDANGKKIADAVFEKVMLNGKLIQERVPVSSASPAAAASDEKNKAALAFSIDKGAIAFKNVRYKAYDPHLLTLTNMRFEVYKGLYKNYDTLKNFTPYKKGSTDSLTWRVGDKRAELVVHGNLNVVTEGDYLFKIRGGGPSALVIDDKEITNNQGTREYTAATFGGVHLSSGSHSFTVYHGNYDECLVLEYEGPGIPFTALTTPASERKVIPAPAMEFVVKTSPEMQRGFMMHHGKVDPYAVSAAFPGGLNYAYDLSTFSLLSAWRGKYVDVSNMWYDRGESQLQIPLGAAVEFDGLPSLFNPESNPGNWPDSVIVDNNMYTNRGYTIDSLGVPAYFYDFKGGKIDDKITGSPDGLLRTVTYSKTTGEVQPTFLLASGSSIEKLPDGSFAIDDKQYYIEFPGAADQSKVAITKFGSGRFGLVWKIAAGQPSQTLKYSLIW